VLTLETVVERLKPYGIDEATLTQWEQALDLSIPYQANGQKAYSPHHINLFKNIQKNRVLGRSLEDIKRIVHLPPMADARPVLGTPVTPPPTPISTPLPAQASISMGESRILHASQPQAVWPAPSSKPEAIVEPVSEPVPEPATTVLVQSSHANRIERTQSMSRPINPVVLSPLQSQPTTPGSAMEGLLEKTLADKDALQQRLIEAEKLNSHLYNANAMYQKRVETLLEKVDAQGKGSLNQLEVDQLGLMEDKARLSGQLLDSEKRVQAKQKEIYHLTRQLEDLKRRLKQHEATTQTALQTQAAQHEQYYAEMETILDSRIRELEADIVRAEHVDPAWFCGDWDETAQLQAVDYDNFGIHIEPQRSRRFRISEPPTRVTQNLGAITTTYTYDANPLWRRVETLYVALHTPRQLQHLSGFLVVEFQLDDTPVAKATFSVSAEKRP